MQLVNLMRLEKQALENQEHPEMIDLIKANISAFKKQIKQIDQKIQDVIQQKEDLRQKADLLTQESGSWKGIQKIRGGCKIVRSALYMAVISAIRHNPKIYPFYQRLIAKGKSCPDSLYA